MSEKKTQSQRLNEKLTQPKRTHTGLRFPQDVESEGTGNIIRFRIALPEGSRYLKNGRYKAVDPSTGQQTTQYRSDSARGSIARRMSDNYVLTTTTIDLYMPSSIQTAYQSDWKSSELGISGQILDAFSGLWNSQSIGDATSSVGKYLADNLGQSTARTLAGVVQGVTAMSPKDAVEMYTSTTENPYMEVLFSGVPNRTFSFDFKFVPRNLKEQQIVKKIVHEFAFHRAPEFKSDSNTVYMLYPSEFDIEFIHKDKLNPWLYKMSTCALTNVSVNYSPEGQYASHEDGSPFATTLSLAFTEMEVLTKQRIEEGY